MRNKLAICLIIIVIIVAQVGLFAESISLEQAREFALHNSRSLAKYNLAIQSSLLNERSQLYSELPSLSMGLSASTSLWTKDGIPQDLMKNTFSAGASAGISYRIWEGGKSSILRAINSLNTEISRQDALAEYYAVLSAVDSAYYAVMEAAAALEAAESSLETANLSLSMAEIRHSSGMISDAVYLQALSEKAARESSRIRSRGDLAMAKLRFKDLLGIDEVPDLEPLDLDSVEELISILSDLDDTDFDRLFVSFWKQVQTNNPSMVKAAMNNERSERNLNLTNRDYSPTLSASFSTGLNYTINNGLEPSGGRLSLSASIPIEFWKTANSVDKQKIAREQASLDFLGAVGSLDMNLRTALLELISQASQIVSSRPALEYSQKSFEYVLELYRLSRNSLKELYDAETLVRNSRDQLNRSQYAFLNGLSKIRSMGAFDSEEEIISLICRKFLIMSPE